MPPAQVTGTGLQVVTSSGVTTTSGSWSDIGAKKSSAEVEIKRGCALTGEPVRQMDA